MSTTTSAPAAAESRTYPSLRAAWIPLAALCLAFFVEMVDNTLLSIALPTIGRDLGSGTTALQWVTGAYSLTFGGLLLTAGSVADRFGRRRVLLVGLAVFGLISLCVVFVNSSGELIALRAALGIAAAAMAPITNSLVFRLFDDKALRMRAITVMMVVGMSGFILGPVLGGTALAHIRWEWLLVVNAPIALIACIGVRLGVAPDRREDLTDDTLDLPGAALSVLTIGLACYAATSGVDHGWASAGTLAAIAGAVLAAIGFVWHERRTASPMLDLGLFSNGTVRGATIAQAGTSIAMAAVMFGLVLHFQLQAFRVLSNLHPYRSTFMLQCGLEGIFDQVSQGQHQHTLGQGGQRPCANADADCAGNEEERHEGQPVRARLGAKTPDLPDIGDDERDGHQPHGMLQAEGGGQHGQGDERQAHAAGPLDHRARRQGRRHDERRLQVSMLYMQCRCQAGVSTAHALREASASHAAHPRRSLCLPVNGSQFQCRSTTH